MTVFVDTSALYALLDADDPMHHDTVEAWRALQEQAEALITSNYVLLETSALVGRRLGLGAVRDLHRSLVPLMRIMWVDEALHDEAMEMLFSAGRRLLSLVGCVSFTVMRRWGIDTAFAFDAHFVEQGFRCLPGQPAGAE